MAVDIDSVVRDLVLNEIVPRLEKGEVPWHRAWSGHSVMPMNPTTGKTNQGIVNPMILWIISEKKEYNDNRWAGFGQWKKTGNPVKKGERSTIIFRPIMGRFKDTDANGDDVLRKYIKGWGYARVFNNQQTTTPLASVETDKVDPSVGFEKAAALIDSLDSVVTHGGDRAYYSIMEDRIRMPEPGAFESVADYWSTSLHEHTHWTGEKERCNRKGITHFGGFGSPTYAYEELVAEMGSATLCQMLGIDRPNLMDNHAAYIGAWVKRLNEDPNTLLDAASEASAAIRFMMGGSNV